MIAQFVILKWRVLSTLPSKNDKKDDDSHFVGSEKPLLSVKQKQTSSSSRLSCLRDDDDRWQVWQKNVAEVGCKMTVSLIFAIFKEKGRWQLSSKMEMTVIFSMTGCNLRNLYRSLCLSLNRDLLHKPARQHNFESVFMFWQSFNGLILGSTHCIPSSRI